MGYSEAVDILEGMSHVECHGLRHWFRYRVKGYCSIAYKVQKFTHKSFRS